MSTLVLRRRIVASKKRRTRLTSRPKLGNLRGLTFGDSAVFHFAKPVPTISPRGKNEGTKRAARPTGFIFVASQFIAYIRECRRGRHTRSLISFDAPLDGPTKMVFLYPRGTKGRLRISVQGVITVPRRGIYFRG